jgi:hypothetical protein
MKFVFIAKHRKIRPVAWLRNAMGVSRSATIRPKAGDQSRVADTGYAHAWKLFRAMDTDRRKLTRHQTGAVERSPNGVEPPPIKPPRILQTASKVSQRQI